MTQLRNNAKLAFIKKDTCAQTLFFLLNREHGATKINEERASDLLAGGIMTKGYQCGMLWGSTLAAGLEYYQRIHDLDQAMYTAIYSTQQIVKSFTTNTGAMDCKDITGCSWNNIGSIAKYFISGGFFKCMSIVSKWSPQALDIIKDSGTINTVSNYQCRSCASEVIKRAGGTDEESVMVAGFAGGIGLSGNACGALGAAIWLKTLHWCKDNPGKTPKFFKNYEINSLLKEFTNATNGNYLCRNICKQTFTTIDEHSEFVKDGGCKHVIKMLSDQLIVI